VPRAGVARRHGGDVGRQEADDDGHKASSVVVVGRGRVGSKPVTDRRRVDEHRHQHDHT